MPLTYDDFPGSWGPASEGWPEVPYSMGAYLLCTKALVVPYGSYVVWAPNYPNHDDAVIRVETNALKKKLEDAYRGMFVECRDTLLIHEFKTSRADMEIYRAYMVLMNGHSM